MPAAAAMYGYSDIAGRMQNVYNLQTVFSFLTTVATILLLARKDAWPMPATTGDPRFENNPHSQRDVYLLIAAAAVFFLMNGLMDARLFPTLNWNYLAFGNVIYPVAIGACLGIGWFHDKFGLRGFKWTIGACTILFLLAPSLMTIQPDSSLCRFVYVLAIVGQSAVIVSIPLYLARLVRYSPWIFLVYTSIYILRSISVFGAWAMKKNGHSGSDLRMILGTLLGIAFYLLMTRVSLFRPVCEAKAEAEDGDREKEPFPEEKAESGPSTTDTFDRYGLSPREREVAGLIIEGAATREIASSLRISEHTVKAHVRNILAKCSAPSQKAFMAMFIHDVHKSS